jgi:hypothetical protein
MYHFSLGRWGRLHPNLSEHQSGEKHVKLREITGGVCHGKLMAAPFINIILQNPIGFRILSW